MNKSYVSEFAVFMNQFLAEHPEAVEEQRRGAGFLLAGESRPDGSGNNPGNPKPE